MTRTLLITLVFAFGASVTLVNCKKKDQNTAPPDITKVSSAMMFSELSNKPQTFTVTAGRDEVILGKDSTIVHFYPYSFKDAAGNILNSGTITIELVEMYKTGKMIANHATTMLSTGEPLKSSGQIYIKAYAANGVEVFAYRYGLSFNAESLQSPMELYYGEKKDAESGVKWNISIPSMEARRDTSVHCNTYFNGSQNQYTFPGWFYTFDSCTNFGYVNSDHPYDTSAVLIKIKVAFPDASYFDRFIGETSVFFTVPADNVVSEPYEVTYNGNILNGQTYAPIGKTFKIYVLSTKGQKYYYGDRTGTVSSEISVNIVMAEETLYNIKSRLEAL